jgi:hypothetical protein
MSDEDEDLKEKQREYGRQYYQANKEQIVKKAKQYYQANKEQIVKKAKQRYQENKGPKKEYDRQRYQENKEKVIEQRRQYRKANKEKICEYGKRYHQANKEKICEYGKRYRKANKEKNTACVYSILNKITDQSYIGETVQYEKREKDHKNNLRGGYHVNSLLQKDYDKYGADAFEFAMVKEINKEDFQSEKELKEYLRVEEAKLVLKEAEEGKELYNLALNPVYIVAVLKERLLGKD